MNYHSTKTIGNEVLKQLYKACKDTKNVPENKKFFQMQCDDEWATETIIVNHHQNIMFLNVKRFLEFENYKPKWTLELQKKEDAIRYY
jgi:hypothetical protein